MYGQFFEVKLSANCRSSASVVTAPEGAAHSAREDGGRKLGQRIYKRGGAAQAG